MPVIGRRDGSSGGNASMHGNGRGCFALVVPSEAIDHRGAGLVEAHHLDVHAVAAELQDRLVEGADGGDVPEMRVADVDDHAPGSPAEIEGAEEGFGRGEEEDRKSTRLNPSHSCASRMPSS